MADIRLPPEGATLQAMAAMNAAIGRLTDAFTAFSAALLTAIQPLADAALDLAVPGYRAWRLREETRIRRTRLVRCLLGHGDDAGAPAWVWRLHAEQIDSFGSGNGHGENWIERGLSRLETFPVSETLAHLGPDGGYPEGRDRMRGEGDGGLRE